MNYTQLSDEELLHLITQQDAEALAHFHDRFAQTTFNLIMHIVRERTLAEDLLQDTFLQVWHKAEDFKGDGVVAAWLYRIARNKCLDALRREKARPQTEELTPLTVEPQSHSVSFPVEQNVNRRLNPSGPGRHSRRTTAMPGISLFWWPEPARNRRSHQHPTGHS